MTDDFRTKYTSEFVQRTLDEHEDLVEVALERYAQIRYVDLAIIMAARDFNVDLPGHEEIEVLAGVLAERRP
jgi:hypothetical protein